MSSGINLVMTVIGFTVSIMFIVYMCISLICARIHLYASRRSFPIASRSDLSILERGLHGLEPVVVANFPTKKYGDEFFSAAGDAQCTVCLAEFRSEDVLRILPHCGHSFHVNCIDIWLRQHSTCPVCRISLHDSPKRVMQSLFSSAFQSHYHAESFDTHSYHCMTTDNGLPLRTHDNLGRGPPEEDHFTAEGGRAESGENVAPFSEDNPGIKNSGTKHIEIPSNP